ncbi:MAG: hypothetical protein JW726_06205 [Anaerolineales bacterium]|nr:hypothetical protein [Anaerolineales bacterium]
MAKFDLVITHPLMNAAGSLGFAPEPRGPVDLTQFGAFVTNPVSLGPRTPARGARYMPFVGGFLLHTGYPNPGLNAVIRRYAGRWARAPLPVILHLLVQQKDDLGAMVERLENLEGISALELGVPSDVAADSLAAICAEAQGELPFIVRLPFERALELAPAALAAGTAAVSISPPRGALAEQNGGFLKGRLYGPALYPQSLLLVQTLVQANIPVIASGGLYSQKSIDEMLNAGALAVQLDGVLWRSWTNKI